MASLVKGRGGIEGIDRIELLFQLDVQLDAMLLPAPQQAMSGWQQLKQDPKKPTNMEVRQYLEHLQWLKSWSTELPAVAHIPVVA